VADAPKKRLKIKDPNKVFQLGSTFTLI
jgi:hypothetical protein